MCRSANLVKEHPKREMQLGFIWVSRSRGILYVVTITLYLVLVQKTTAVGDGKLSHTMWKSECQISKAQSVVVGQVVIDLSTEFENQLAKLGDQFIGHLTTNYQYFDTISVTEHRNDYHLEQFFLSKGTVQLLIRNFIDISSASHTIRKYLRVITFCRQPTEHRRIVQMINLNSYRSTRSTWEYMSNTFVPNEYEIVRVAELFWICRTKLKLNVTGDSCEVHEKFTRTLYRVMKNTNNARFAEACVSGSSMFKVLFAKLLTVSYRSSMGNGPSALVPDTDPCVDGLLELLTVEVAENVMVNRTFGTRVTAGIARAEMRRYYGRLIFARTQACVGVVVPMCVCDNVNGVQCDDHWSLMSEDFAPKAYRVDCFKMKVVKASIASQFSRNRDFNCMTRVLCITTTRGYILGRYARIFKCETSIPNSDSNKTHKHSRLDAKPHENVKRRTPKMRNAMTAKSTESGTGCFSGTRDSAGFQAPTIPDQSGKTTLFSVVKLFLEGEDNVLCVFRFDKVHAVRHLNTGVLKPLFPHEWRNEIRKSSSGFHCGPSDMLTASKYRTFPNPIITSNAITTIESACQLRSIHYLLEDLARQPFLRFSNLQMIEVISSWLEQESHLDVNSQATQTDRRIHGSDIATQLVTCLNLP
ncbi:hypothetical protein CLF_102840, partial [Clonorchis sinensis]